MHVFVLKFILELPISGHGSKKRFAKILTQSHHFAEGHLPLLTHHLLRSHRYLPRHLLQSHRLHQHPVEYKLQSQSKLTIIPKKPRGQLKINSPVKLSNLLVKIHWISHKPLIRNLFVYQHLLIVTCLQLTIPGATVLLVVDITD